MINSKLTLLSALAFMNIQPGLLTTGFATHTQNYSANRIKRRKVYRPKTAATEEILQHNARIDAKNEAKRLRKLSTLKP